MLLTVLKGLSANQQKWRLTCIQIHCKVFFHCSSGAIHQSGHLSKIYVRLRKVLVIKLSAHNSVSLLAVTGNKGVTDKNKKKFESIHY